MGPVLARPLSNVIEYELIAQKQQKSVKEPFKPVKVGEVRGVNVL